MTERIETIAEMEDCAIVQRVRVPGGWLYRWESVAFVGEADASHVTFVAEPGGWK